MYDVKPQILALLESIPGVTVAAESSATPAALGSLPHISFFELENKEGLPAWAGLLTEVLLQVDVWHSASTEALAQQVNERLIEAGFRRKAAADATDEAKWPDVNRKTMRYTGIIDARNHRVLQKPKGE